MTQLQFDKLLRETREGFAEAENLLGHAKRRYSEAVRLAGQLVAQAPQAKVIWLREKRRMKRGRR